MSRRGLSRAASGVAALALLATLGSCGADTPPAAPTPGSTASTEAVDLASTHIHAATRDPQTSDLLLATHEGLLRQTAGRLHRVGPVIDLMSFAIGPDGTFYASGHPGPGTDLPEPVGLITSVDSGRSWQIASRAGESDFHALAVGPTSIAAYDGTLVTTKDRQNWTTRAIGSPPRTLAAAPGSGTLLATTAVGLLRSADDAASWQTLMPPEVAVLAAWADERTAVIATTTGRLAVSEDAGATWELGPASLGEIQTLSAQRTSGDSSGGRLEVITVVGARVLRTTDAGATTEVLAP